MSIQNFLISRFLKSRLKASLKIPADIRLHKGRKFLNQDRSKPDARVAVRSGVLAGVQVEWVEPIGLVGDKSAPVCMYTHGGGYIAGSVNSHRDMARYLARLAHVRMLMVDYRLAPEHPFPAAREDALAVYQGLLDSGIAGSQIILGGDSAGGNLALVTAQSIRDAGLASPCALVLFSPWLDMTHQSSTYQTNAAKDAMLARPLLEDAAAMYAPGMARTDERISPLFGNLEGLPPCLTIVSQTEVLLDDSRGLHRKLQALGLRSTCLEWKNTPHAFAVMPSLLPEARDALRQTADFIARVRHH
ncbi:MAG: alpha/beta hydrolase [Rhodoferax sp.]